MYKSAILYGSKDLREELYSLSPPNTDELQISIKLTGICGSDLHYYNHYRNGNIEIKSPMILGHESSGIVEIVGDSLKDQFKPGDRVALEVGIPCEKCEYCSSKRYNICKEIRFLSSARRFPHDNGTLRERMNHPGKYCYKLPEGMSLELGALLEPLSVALHSCNRLGNDLIKDKTVLIMGCGTIGLLVSIASKLKGSKSIHITDINQERIDWAIENRFVDLGWKMPLNKSKDIEQNLEFAKNIPSLMEKNALTKEYDIIFECTGVQSCLQTAIYLTKPGGKIVLIGMGTPIQTLPISDAALREVDLIGSFRYSGEYLEAINLFSSTSSLESSNRPLSIFSSVEKLITHRFKGFDSIKDAFEVDPSQMMLKVMIDFT